MKPVLLLLGCWLLVVASASSAPAPNNTTGENSSPIRCGYVYDGDKLIYDIDYQVSTSSITANWFGFDTPMNPVVLYEWSIVSESLRTKEFSVEAKQRCRSAVDAVIEPDVLDWTSVGTTTSATSSSLTLQVGHRYFILVRAHYASGEVILTNSDGVEIVQPSAHSAAADGDLADVKSISLQDLEAAYAPKREQTKSIEEPDTRAVRSEEQEPFTCSIDRENACRKGRIGVGELLTELYGPPVFVRDPSIDSNVDILYAIQSSDTSGLTDGEKAGIIIACIIVFLLILLPLYCLKGKGKSNKFQTNPNRTENIENI